jgi:hypothetical protein
MVSLRTSLEGAGGSENPQKLLPMMCPTIKYGTTPIPSTRPHTRLVILFVEL